MYVLVEQKVNPKTGEVSDVEVGLMDVYQEFNELSEKFKIMKFKSKVRPRFGVTSPLHLLGIFFF